MSKLPITEDDLHAYIDGELDTARRAEVKEHLAAHPEDAERLRTYEFQGQAMRALFKPVLDEPLPEKLRTLASPPSAVPAVRSSRPRWLPQRLAAGICVAMFGGVIGWLLHGRYQASENLARTSPLPHQAAIAHVVFSPDQRRPVEVTAEHEDQLVAWLSRRLGTPVHPPRLGELGYELIGGRLLPGDNGPVAQFMYHDGSGQRLTLYISTDNGSNRDTAFSFAQEGQVNVFYWIDGKYGYALSAVINKGELAKVATLVYDQIERK